MSIIGNLIVNSTEDGATSCNASTNMSQSLACASYYSTVSQSRSAYCIALFVFFKTGD